MTGEKALTGTLLRFGFFLFVFCLFRFRVAEGCNELVGEFTAFAVDLLLLAFATAAAGPYADGQDGAANQTRDRAGWVSVLANTRPTVRKTGAMFDPLGDPRLQP